MQKARCPICRSDAIIEDGAYEGDLITCSNCLHDLEIISLNPPLLSPIIDQSDENLSAEKGEE